MGPCTNLHTVITNAAVGAAGRPVKMARSAPLHPDLDALYVHVLVQRSAELVVLVLVLVGWKTISEGGKISTNNGKKKNVFFYC